MMQLLKNLTLARQYMFASLIIMLLGMVLVGFWISRQIEEAVTKQTAAVTALYVDNFISPHLQSLHYNDWLSDEERQALADLMSDPTLGKEIVSFKIWSPNGTILYSPNPDLVGQQFVIEGGLAEAFSGEVVSEVSDLGSPEQVYERAQWEHLIETYAPVRARGSGDIIAVSEFYQLTSDLEAEIRRAQINSWLLIGAVMVGMYLLLAGLVGRASNTIVQQQSQLQDNVSQLERLLGQNRQLNRRVRRAAARSTAINEQYLRRIAAELHDGPAQDLALALLRIDSLASSGISREPAAAADFQTVHVAIESAMAELRTISAGLRLPEIEGLSVREIVRRALHDFEQKTHQSVKLIADHWPEEAPVPVKITLYRVLREALANGYRHAGGKAQQVEITADARELCVAIADSGPGLDPAFVPGDSQFGLVGMQERVELLGGQFQIEGNEPAGTIIRISLPLTNPEVTDV
ncbi:MAG: hypothetical protein KDE04_10805 [Anaerolineales bacterium]|nr:hypothetical protein [Anaerolineales bacterium]MCB0030853.1 hypothetical protein [Anaerolineales bacterium]MCB8958701.1 sensor histidine kinase [Ardenticatenales bacterium]